MRVQRIILEIYTKIADIFVLKTISPIEKCAVMIQLRNSNEMEQKSSKTRDYLNEQTAREPIELIHMDLCGFMPTKSLEGNKYVYVLLDEYSRDTWVKFWLETIIIEMYMRDKIPGKSSKDDNTIEKINRQETANIIPKSV
uniref:Uncharacterized protein n=1 Tax=Vespula pensylvanica TaxID=30213 RepID=A0A834UGW7_VESPE|nr:hypothetical protein H0235_000994 [Vespula pensylvanica]